MNASASDSKLASLRRFLDADPDNSRLRRDYVDTAVAAGEFGLVREIAEKRLATLPADPEAQFDRATALIGLKDFAGALEALRPLDATIPGVRFNTGLCLFMLHNYAEARPFFQAGYEAGERSASQLRCFLRTLHHLGEVDEAVAIANDNATLVQSDGALAGVCALIYLDANETKRAALCARRALAANPDNIDALVSAGTLSAADLDASNARAAFSRVVDLAPANGRAWLGLGTLSMAARDFPRAAQEIERGLETMPSHVGSWHALAWTHLFSGNLDKAEAVFQHAMELNHNFSETHGSLAVIAAMRGDREAAERGIEVAERLDSECMSSKYARTLLVSSPEESRQMLIDLVATVPGQGKRLAEFLRDADRTSKR